MDGNPFGHSITYRDGSSIKLLDYNEDKKIVLRDDALDILRRIQEPVAIISLVGSYRRGKSWLANVLHGRHDGFTLGHGTAGETRGIYMWNSPFMYKGKRIIVLDSEGLDDPKRDAGFATKLFVLCLAISSSFIYNINGIVGKEDVEKLFLMTDLSRFVNPNDTNNVMPHLIVLLRDFTLERPDDLGEYFLDQLRSVNVEAANNLGDKFSEFSIYGLPHPGLSSYQLRELHEIHTSEFDEEFIEEVTNAVNEILDTVQPKYIDSNPVNGDVLATFLECCIQTLNAGDNQFDLTLSTNYDSIVQYAAGKAATEAFDWYRSMMVAELNESILPVPWIVFNNVQEESLRNAENCFNNSLVGNGMPLMKAYQEFRKNVDTFLTRLREQNSKLLYSCNRDTAVLLWDQLVTSHLTADDLFISVELLEQAIERFEEQYLDARLDCPEALQVLDEFKSIYCTDARRLFNTLKTFREVVEIEKLLAIEAQNDRATAQAELPKIAGRMEGFDEISRRQKEEADRYRQQAEEMERRVRELEQQMQRREGEYKAMINNLQNELRTR